MSNIITYTGKTYGEDGKFFTVRMWDKNKGYYESEEFIQIERLPKTITLDMFKYFLGESAKTWLDFFGEEIIEKNLPSIRVLSFLSWDNFEDKQDGNYGHLAYTLRNYRGWLYGKRSICSFTEHKGEWHRHYTAPGYDILHRSHYTTWESDFITKCLLDKFPYLEQFEFKAYGVSISSKNMGDNELYLTVKEAKENKETTTSIYVPLSALALKDFGIIVERMTSYFNWYYAGESKKEYLNQALSLLDSKEAEMIKQFLVE